tara:strand:+ start:592 stop:789 length:198 start_codon:yes stop_codon:yes gene_type:complete
MWKVVIIMCALGNPCVVMEESPMRHYHDRNECMANSSSKHSELFVAFQDYGYHVYKSEFTCEEVK